MPAESLPVLYETQDNLAILTLNRPSKINAMDGEVYDLMERYVRDFEADPDLRCLIITGAGGNFSAGGDLKWLQDMHEKHDTPEKVWNAHFEAYDLLERLTKPVISAIDGFCVASAFNLSVLYTDIRVATARAKFGIPGPRRGLGIGPYPMPWNNYAGIGNIMYMTLTGKHLSSEEALRMGFINEIVDSEDPLPRAIELAKLVAEGNPREIAGLKEFWRKYPELPGGSYMLLANTIREKIDAGGHDRSEGRRAFIEKRATEWSA